MQDTPTDQQDAAGWFGHSWEAGSQHRLSRGTSAAESERFMDVRLFTDTSLCCLCTSTSNA